MDNVAEKIEALIKHYEQTIKDVEGELDFVSPPEELYGHVSNNVLKEVIDDLKRIMSSYD